MNQLPFATREALKRLLMAGASHRAIAAALGVSKVTVTKYAQQWTFRPICGCGKTAGHIGWCHVRLDYSPQRRGWLAKRWRKRADTDLSRTVDAATAEAKALGHELGLFIWSSAGASSMAFAMCRICGKQVRVFGGEAQWERYQGWKRFAGTAVTVRCKTAEQRAAETAAQQEKRKWREGKRTLLELKKVLRNPSHSPSAAFTPAPSSPR